MSDTCNIEALMCFAKHPNQTYDEVFDMIQERMLTMLGCAYSEQGFSIINWQPEWSITQDEMESISNWQNSSMILKVEDFDRIGAKVGLSISDVLGEPKIEAWMRREISKKIDLLENGGLDGVVALVILLSIESFDFIAQQRQELMREIKYIEE